MTIDIEPILDNWYLHLDKGQKFKVVAIDDDNLVEIQHFDGDLEEITRRDWDDMDIELSEEPQNWTGSYDIAETDDLGADITETSKEDWDDSLDQFKQPLKQKLTPDP